MGTLKISFGLDGLIDGDEPGEMPMVYDRPQAIGTPELV
jgi:hypothetical protein